MSDRVGCIENAILSNLFAKIILKKVYSTQKETYPSPAINVLKPHRRKQEYGNFMPNCPIQEHIQQENTIAIIFKTKCLINFS